MNTGRILAEGIRAGNIARASKIQRLGYVGGLVKSWRVLVEWKIKDTILRFSDLDRCAVNHRARVCNSRTVRTAIALIGITRAIHRPTPTPIPLSLSTG